MAEKNIDVALESTSQEILTKLLAGTSEKVYTPSDNLVATVLSTEQNAGNGSVKYIAKWIPERSGIVKIIASLKTSSTSNVGCWLQFATPSIVDSSGYTSSMYYRYGYAMVKLYDIESLSVGATFSSSDTINNLFAAGHSLNSYINAFTTVGTLFYVKKGSPVYFLLGSANASTIGSCNSIKIYADEV